MQKIALINVEEKYDSDGVLHLIPTNDLIKHKLVGCTCGHYRKYFESEVEEDDRMDPDEFDEFEDDLAPEKYAVVHKSMDGREHIAVALSFDFQSGIKARADYLLYLKDLKTKFDISPTKQHFYLFMFDTAFNSRWNTN